MASEPITFDLDEPKENELTQTMHPVAQAVTDALLGIDLTNFQPKMLEVCTSMISKTTADALGQDASCREALLWNVLAYEPWGEYGWIIHTSSGFSEHDDMNAYPELATLLNFAQERGFKYLKLDCDGERLPPGCGLPTFSW